MKAIKKATLTIAAVAAVAFSGCGKTSNSGSGTTASTPTTTTTATCTVQPDGTIKNGSGQVCTSGTAVCPANGQYIDSNGAHLTCNAGSTIYINQGYPYGQNPNGANGCMYWSQYYNTLYVPMILQGQLVCVNYNWLNQYMSGSAYFDNYNYYYQYPPYSDDQYSCGGNSVYLQYGSFAGQVCF